MAVTSEIQNQEQWIGVIARALAYLCVHSTDLREADLTSKALLLESFGLSRPDIALLLNSTEDAVRVSINAAKRQKGKRGGRKKK
jgi:hypothetical protein